MAYWLIAYVIGYLVGVIIITLHDNPDDWKAYGLIGLIILLWPFIVLFGVFGLIPWLVSKAKSAR